MAKNPKKRQQKLEKRKAKRKEKKHEIVREQSKGLPQQLQDAASAAVLHAYMAHSIDEMGIGVVLISRELPNKKIAFASFMVDRFCLGVKDAYAQIINRTTYDEKLIRRAYRNTPFDYVDPARARKFVEEAVRYARDLGFQPHPDYQRAKLIFGDIDPSQCGEEFEFGRDGKPLFINGPNDSETRIQYVMKTLEERCGKGGYNVMLGGNVTGSDGYLVDLAQDEEGEEPPAELEHHQDEEKADAESDN